MSLTFADNDNGIGGVLNFGESITKKFTIENTGTLDAYAKISWFNITNTYLEGSLVYTLKFSNEENGHYRNFVTEKNVPTNITKGTEVLANGLLIPAGEKYYYELEILLVNSKTVDQTADLNASFWSQFTLESGTPAANEVLASLGLEDSIKVEPSTYNMFSFTTSGYNGSTSYAGQSVCVYNGHIAMNITGEVTSETCSNLYYVMMYGNTFYVDSSFETLNIGKSNN